jgi:hypothetical protein
VTVVPSSKPGRRAGVDADENRLAAVEVAPEQPSPSILA